VCVYLNMCVCGVTYKPLVQASNMNFSLDAYDDYEF